MLRKLSEPLQQFLGFVGASLTGITAVFTAAGFLAERARLTMLGLPSTTFDLQQYLETGARFLAFLPLYLGMAFFYTVLGVLSNLAYWLVGHLLPGGILILLAGAGGVGWWIVTRRKARGEETRSEEEQGEKVPAPPAGSDASPEAKAHKGFVQRNFSGLLCLFLLAQFVAAYQMTQALGISNVLFDSERSPQLVPHLEFSIVQTETLQAWIMQGTHVNSAQYMGWLFLVTVVPALGLYLLVRRYRGDEALTPNAWQTTWFAASVVLLATQITLLPINYGILLTTNRFVEVSVAFTEAEGTLERPPDDHLYLLHETGSGFYLYSRADKKVWYVLRGDVRSMQHHRMARILND